MAPKTILGSSLALALCGLTGPVFAQDQQTDPTTDPLPAPEQPAPAPQPAPEPAPPPIIITPPAAPTNDDGAYKVGFHDGYSEADTSEPARRSPIAAVTLGGGVSTFTRQDVRDATGTAGNWDVRAAFGAPLLPFGIEAAYTGSAQSIDAIGLDSGAVLVGNGIEADLKFQLPLPVSPYAVVGAGWRNYQIVNADTNTSDIADDDNLLEVPLGVGVNFNGLGLAFDLRATYRHAFEDDLMGGDQDQIGDEIDSTSGDLHRVGVNLGAGMSF